MRRWAVSVCVGRRHTLEAVVMQPGTSDSVVLGSGMAAGIFKRIQDDAEDQKPLVLWKRHHALLFRITNVRF